MGRNQIDWQAVAADLRDTEKHWNSQSKNPKLNADIRKEAVVLCLLFSGLADAFEKGLAAGQPSNDKSRAVRLEDADGQD